MHVQQYAARPRLGIFKRGPLGNGNAVAFRQSLESLRKRQPIDLLHEAENVALGIAPEAFVKLVRLVDVEGRSLLLMKRAEADVTSGAPKRLRRTYSPTTFTISTAAFTCSGNSI